MVRRLSALICLAVLQLSPVTAPAHPGDAAIDPYQIEYAADADSGNLRTQYQDSPLPGLAAAAGTFILLMMILVMVNRHLHEQRALLRQSEYRYRSVVDALSEGVVLLDRDGRITTSNPAAERILGLSAGMLSGISVTDPDWNAVHDDGRPYRGEEMPGLVTLRTAQPLREVEMGLRRTTGEVTWLLVNTQPLFQCGEDTPHATVVSFTDITDRRRSETTLRERENRLSTLVSSMRELLFVLDEEGRYLDYHAPDKHDLLVPPERFLGQHFSSSLPAEVAQVIQEAIDRVRATGQPSRCDYRLDLPGAGTRDFSADIVPLVRHQGHPSGFLGVVRDVTEERRMEQQLRIAATAFEAMEGMFVTDRHGVILQVNTAFTRITGYSAEDAVGRNPNLLRSGLHDDAFYRQIWDSIGQHGSWQGEIWNRRKDGSLYPQELLITAVKDRHAQVTHYVATLRDITQRVANREALLEAKNQAEAANRAKSEFLASMSHELRTPLNAILGFAQLLDIDDSRPDEDRDNIRQIHKAGRHLLTIINDLIDLARIDTGQLTLSIEAVPLGSVLKESLEFVSGLATERRVRIHLPADLREEMLVKADYTRLRQALINLLSNAVKYNHPQGWVHVTLEHPDAWMIRVCVTDSGPGIPAHKQERLFVPFDRLGIECKHVEGTGIGLIITRRLVEAMAGRIGFSSREGEGSTFWLDLPLADAGSQPSLLPLPDTQPSGIPAGPAETTPHSDGDRGPLTTDHVTVLYVEDNPASRRLMERVLGHHDRFALMLAEDAETGIALARRQPPAIVLMDINLPGMTGYEALEALKSWPETAHIPVVAISANAMKGDQERGRQAGFAHYLTKPLDIPKLMEVLEQLTSGSS